MVILLQINRCEIDFSYVVEDILIPALENSVGPAEVQIPGAMMDGEDEVYEVYLPVVHDGVPVEKVALSTCRNEEKHGIKETNNPGD